MNKMTTAHTTAAPLANVEAEQQLLGAILLNNDLYHRVSDVLTDRHFFDPVHQRIFTVCGARIRAGHLADPQSIRNVFDLDEGLQQLGGASYLVRMASAAVSSHAIRSYAEIIIDQYQRRVLIQALDEARAIVAAGGDVMQAQAGVEATGQLLAVADRKKPTTSLIAATVKAMAMVHDAYQGTAVGLACGIRSFDDLTGGFFPEDMVVLAGGPSMGKTTAALALTQGYAKAGHGVCFVSLEMGDYSLAQRLISAESGVAYRLLRRGDLTQEEAVRAAHAAKAMQDWPVEIVNGHVRDIAAIYSTARRVQRDMESRVPGGLRILIVDYLQLVRTPAKDRFQMVGEVSMGLKNIAKQLGIPVLALSQISRDVAGRDDKRPRLADLRESAQIEQDADMVLFTHRDHYYLQREGPQSKGGKVKVEDRADYEAALSASKQQMDILLAKHRHDGIGDVKLGCDMPTNRLWDLQHGQQERMGF